MPQPHPKVTQLIRGELGSEPGLSDYRILNQQALLCLCVWGVGVGVCASESQRLKILVSVAVRTCVCVWEGDSLMAMSWDDSGTESVSLMAELIQCPLGKSILGLIRQKLLYG